MIIPEGTSSSCCGMMFDTRGFRKVAEDKRLEVEAMLAKASENGKYPIVIDTSPCTAAVKGKLQNQDLRFAIYEPVEFISRFLTSKLEWTKVRDQVAIHVPCSSKQMGLSSHFSKVGGRGLIGVVSLGMRGRSKSCPAW